MRQFELLNEYGQSFGLNDVRTGFLQNPDGLGYSTDYKFSKIGTSWIPQYIKDTQVPIRGEVVFGTSEPYTAQQDFLKFTRESNKLKLKRTTTAGVRYKDVVISEYEISEITDGNVLVCPIKMLPKSLWYENEIRQVVAAASGSDVTRYSYIFPSRFNDYPNGSVEVLNSGSVPSGFTAEFYGSVSNPVISLYVNGVEKAKVEIDESVTSGEKIYFSSVDGNLFCYSGSDADIQNFKVTGIPTNLDNLSYGFSIDNENFFKVPIGNSTIQIAADSPLTNPVVLTTYRYYRAC